MRLHLCPLAAWLLLVGSSAPTAAQTATAARYRLVQPEVLAGAWSSRARAIAGERFVGDCNGGPSRDGYDLAVLWNKPGDPRVLGGIGVSVSSANDVNERGAVVGFADFIAGVGDEWSVAFVWEQGVYRALPDLVSTGFPFSVPHAINERGEVVGDSTVPFGRHAVLWRGDRALDLGTLGGPSSEARDLDESGRIVGSAQRADLRSVAVLWVPRASAAALGAAQPEHRIVELVDLGGPTAVAMSIDATGRVVGRATVLDASDSRPFLWESGATVELAQLGAPAGANAIADSGTIVGSSAGRAVLWRAGDLALVDLNAVTSELDGWVLREAYDVDSGGRIAGRATDAHGNPRAFVLDPL